MDRAVPSPSASEAALLDCCCRRPMRSPPGDLSFARLEEDAPTRPIAPSTPPLVLVAFIFPALAGFNFGFDIGSTSGAVQQLRGVDSELNASPLLVGLLTSGSLFGTVCGTALSFVLGAPLGRRGELLLASCLYAMGTLITTLAPANSPILLTLVFLGRTVYGLGVAFAMHAAPVYIAEIAPPAVRGLLVSLKEGFIVLGILSGFAASATASAAALAPTLAFRAIWSPPLVVSVIVFAGMLFMPASPRWLMVRALSVSRVEAAECALRAGDSLRRLRSSSLDAIVCDDDAVDDEIDSIVHALTEQCKEGDGRGEAGCAEVLGARRALTAGLGLVVLQQVTGQPSVLYYQEAIFRDAGFGELASSASVIVGGAKLLATLFTVLKVEHYGRKPLLFAGIIMMIVALVTLAIAFHERPQYATGSDSFYSALIVGALMVYVCGYQVGFGPISWLMISEVFPLRTRGTALSIAVSVNFCGNLLVTFTLPSIQQWFDAIEPGKGISYLFGLYVAFCLLSLGFVAACVPETKGKSLEQIEAEMKE